MSDEIKFSDRGNGACPLCKKFETCRILSDLEESLKRSVSMVNDETMEIVIYRCPEFIESES